MAILEKEVLVGLNGRNIKYFKNLGYIIPINPISKMISVKTVDLLKGSGQFVTKICDDCGKQIPNQQYKSILNYRENGDGNDRCFDCSQKQNGIKRSNNIKYESSLDNYAIRNNKSYLIKEFSSKNKKSISNVAYGSNKEFIWNCFKCNSEYPMSVDSRTLKECDCPYCAGRRVNETNCMWTTHPHIAKLLNNRNRGYEITAGSGRFEDFKCETCGHINNIRVCDVYNKGFWCSNCSDGISYPEKFIRNLLTQLNIRFISQKKFNWSTGKRYDFYIPLYNLIIETNGRQHYEESTRGRSLKKEQENDDYKKEISIKNGIKHYIPIDCRYSDMDFIRSNILSSKLNILYDLSIIDWLKCHEFACSSLVTLTCEFWNKGHGVNEITEIINLSLSSVTKYLKQGKLIGLCDYDPKKYREVVQLSSKDELLKFWSSISEASRSLDISPNTISSVCKNKKHYYSAGGYKWMYKEDYDKSVSNT